MDAYLHEQENKTFLRFITCGSVDDGKSTLLGRLLFDCQTLLEDQLAELHADSARYGTTGAGNLDFALLADGLAAEREQGITIDVAYRFFTTHKRKYIVADTPGHEQYTRNMVTGASTADLAVLLLDARKGMMTQTRRHSYLVSLLGIRHIVLAVNKMDLVNWEQGVFDQIASDYRVFATALGIENLTCIPVSAINGDNVSRRSHNTSWYDGPTLLDHLEGVEIADEETDRSMRMPVQWVNRPNADMRAYCGTIASGALNVGDEVTVLPSGKSAAVSRILTMDGDLERAAAGQAISLLLSGEIDVSRGDIIVSSDARPEIADQFAAHIVWMSEQRLVPGRQYILQSSTMAVIAQVTEIKHKVNVNTLEKNPAKHLELNDVALCNIAVDRAIPFDAYADNRETGSFILVDRSNNATIGCGMIDFALRRAANIHRQVMEVGKVERAALNKQKPCILWFTGLSGAGKSTVANLVEERLHSLGHLTMSLDGDNVRHGLNQDLGFTEEDRVENIRRVAEVAKLMVEAGLITLVSLISPFRSERRSAREAMEKDEFIEIFVDTPIEVCEARDVKGLYAKARAGEIPNFTGIGSPYEPPDNPELRLAADTQTPDEMADRVIALMEERHLI